MKILIPAGAPVYSTVSGTPFAFGPSVPSGSRYSSLLSFEWDRAERRQKEDSIMHASFDGEFYGHDAQIGGQTLFWSFL